MPFLHRFEQSRLSFRWRAVDLVGQDHIGEYRTSDETETPPPCLGVVLEDVGSSDVRGHHVGRELDAAKGKLQDPCQSADKQGLGQSRYTYEENVTAGKQSGEEVLNNALLANNYLADLTTEAPVGLCQRGDPCRIIAGWFDLGLGRCYHSENLHPGAVASRDACCFRLTCREMAVKRQVNRRQVAGSDIGTAPGLKVDYTQPTYLTRTGPRSMDSKRQVESLLEAYPVSIAIPVQWGDQDAFGHVNNTIYFRWFESARIAYFMKMGLPAFQTEDRIGSILAASSCDYRQSITFPDTVHVGIRVTRIGRTSIGFSHRIVSESLGGLAAEGTSTAVVFDYDARRPHPVSESMRQTIAVLEGKTF